MSLDAAGLSNQFFSSPQPIFRYISRYLTVWRLSHRPITVPVSASLKSAPTTVTRLCQ